VAGIFVTGGGGFVGGFVLAALRSRGLRATVLDRSGRAPAAEGLHAVRGELGEPAGYLGALRETDTVLHLAAATGKATAAEHRRVNLDGTVALLEACREAGVRRFLFVSSIAVKFPDKRDYPYARAKQQAERAVRESGLRFTIVRPTIVAGRGSPVMAGLGRLAGLPVLPLFGGGRGRIQPVHVADLAELMLDVLEADAFDGGVLEFGGRDVVTTEELLRSIRERLRGRRGPAVRLPVGPLLPLLRAAERVLGPGRLPVTAGQLCSLRFDGTAEDNPFRAARRESLRGVPEMLAEEFAR